MKEFGDLASFAAHLVLAEVAAHKALEKGLDKAAAHIERAAKGKIGEYQEANGMHEAWPELADSTKEDRVRKGFTENDPGLRSGAMRDSISHETRGLESAIGSDDQNLVWFELGTDKQPPRSVLGAAAYESIDEVKKLVGGAVITGIVGGNSLDYKV